MQTTEETPQVASVALAPDFDGYLFAVTMDNSCNDTLCPSVGPPTALARRRANTTPLSHGLSVFLLIASESAVTGCPRDWRLNVRKQLHFHAARGNQAMEHCGEKDVLFTSAVRKSTVFNLQVCNVRFPIVSVYRLTRAGSEQEVNDTTAQLKLAGGGAQDLDLIDWRHFWLEL